jgi:hypothetical protein
VRFEAQKRSNTNVWRGFWAKNAAKGVTGLTRMSFQRRPVVFFTDKPKLTGIITAMVNFAPEHGTVLADTSVNSNLRKFFVDMRKYPQYDYL